MYQFSMNACSPPAYSGIRSMRPRPPKLLKLPEGTADGEQGQLMMGMKEISGFVGLSSATVIKHQKAYAAMPIRQEAASGSAIR
ncbi:MAG: hypothetical protein V1797_18120 [Pseudomonadota bacterium]